jgi:glutaredoxin
MKELKIFYQEKCPFCKRAFRYIEELKEENSAYKNITPICIEETIEEEYANSYDYYYVPTFYIDEVKVHEGGIMKEEVKEILNRILES